MKAQDTKFSEKQLDDCAEESSEAQEICRLAKNKIKALKRKVQRLEEKADAC